MGDTGLTPKCLEDGKTFRSKLGRDFLVVQWLKLCTFNVGGVGSVTGGELAPMCCAIHEEGVTEVTCCLVYEADTS